MFGQKASKNKEHCQCNPGYWGSECDKTCPGGAKKPCNKHGICDRTSGQCICDITWRGNKNCSKCSTAWSGDDCSVAVSKVTVSSTGFHSAGIFGNSHFTTLDGRSYTLNITGEYYLFFSVHVNFFIQIRLVQCRERFSCVNSVAFRTSSHSLVLHGPYITTGHPVIWLDQSIVNLYLRPITASSYGFLFRKQSETLYVFEYSTLQISIRIYGKYLSLISKISGSLCEGSYGMLGSCNKHFLESYRPDFLLSNCTTKKQSKELPYAHDSTNFIKQIVKELIGNLEVSGCDSLFVYSFKHYHEHRKANSGYALLFSSSAVVSSYIVEPFQNNEITIEFYLKTIKPGVILSYSKIKTFVLTNTAGYFTIYFGDKTFNTNIKAQQQQMGQIVLVFRKLTMTLQFYHFNHEGILTRQDIAIGEDAFSPGGILAIGAWQPSLDGTGVQLQKYFTGYIDELKIWTIAYHPAVISQSWLKQVGLNTKHLVRLWKFDEGEGTEALEHITGSSLHLETAPWRKPTWVYSELNLKPLLESALNYKVNSTLTQDVKRFCSEVILTDPLHSACKSLGSGISAYYYKACFTIAVTSADIYASLEVVIAYADYCQSILSLQTWPARLLCNKFHGKEFPVWFGPRCDKKCFNKNPTSKICICRQGYWGKECQNVCPGGTVHPCNDHGICDVTTGVCSCADNWKGSQDCGSCTRNWKGIECALANVGFVSVRAIAVASTSAHYVTFDGLAFGLATVGDFYLLKTRISISDYFIIQVRHAPCQSQSVCIVAVAIQFSTTVIVIHAPIFELSVPVISVDGTKIAIDRDRLFGEGNATIALTLDAPSKYTVSTRDVFSLEVRIVGTTLSLAMDVNKPYCNGNVPGIFGDCDNILPNDLYLSENTTLDNVSQQLLNEHLLKKMEVGLEKDMFRVLDKVYNKISLHSGAQYALGFNGSGAVSVPLLLTFAENTDVTIELLFKAFSNGTPLSYASNQTFAIIVKSTLHVEFDKDYDTGVYIGIGSWYHVAITWHYKIKLLQLYITNNKGNVSRREFKIYRNPFIPGGVLSLGYWEPSAGDNEERLRNRFVGVIDEIRVWHRSFNPVTVQQNWRMNVNPTAPCLSGLWKLNEGSGTTAYNLINNEHIHLPSEVWSPPQWEVSDVDIALNVSDIKMPFEIYFANETLRDESKSWCQSLFYRGPLEEHCKKLGALVEFYHLRCVQTIARTTQISSSLNVVIEFSDYCQKVLSLTSWPARTLCNKFGIHIKFPNWIGFKCDVLCIFGNRDPGNLNRCKCIQGYWGDDCSKVCPGGYSNPCFGNGVCNSAIGKCKCEINWRGDDNCSKCSEDWFGKQCHLAATKKRPLLNNSFSIASINGHGYYTTFLGISFYLPIYGEFYLIRSSQFYVQVRQSPCMYHSFYRPLCTTAFAFKFENNLAVTIHAHITRFNVYYPLLWTNGRKVRVDHVTHLSATVRMTRIKLNRYEITGPKGLVIVFTAGQSISIQLRIPVSWCAKASGMLGACLQRLSYQNATDIVNLKRSIENTAVCHSESLFVYEREFFHETQNLTGAGFNLRIINSHVVSDTLLLGKYDTVTIEVFVKIKKYGGTLLSCGRENFLSVTSEKEVRLVYGSVEIKTGLSLNVDIWSKITLVWSKSTNVLQLYYQNFADLFLLRTYQLKTRIFLNQERIYVGEWKSGNNRKAKAPTSDFEGEVDEIRIWNRVSVPDLVRRNWNINANVTFPGLIHLWKLDHVEGLTAVDSISGKLLHLPIFNKPSWEFSNLPIPKNSLVNDVSFLNSEIETQAEKFCYSVILSGPLNNNCRLLGPAVADSYYKICLLAISSTNNISMAIEAVMSFADFCQESLSLTFWPARELCNRFANHYFRGWIGASCDISCIFGTPQIINGSTICICSGSYWGPACDKLCPGGLWNVCGNHGKCDSANGSCECDARWKGHLKNNASWALPCSVCTHGWRGKDCSIGIEHSFSNSTFLAKFAICAVFGDPHVTSFNRTNYHLGITGAFDVFTSTSSSLQMLQVPCANSQSCRRIREFGLFLKSFNISLRMSRKGQLITNATSQSVIKSMKTLHYSTSWLELGSGSKTRFRWLDHHRIEIVNEENIKITILAYFGTLAAVIEIPRNVKTERKNLCGSSNGEWERDIYENLLLINQTKAANLLDNFNQTTHDAYINEQMRISSATKTVMLTHDAVKYKTGGGYMVRLFASYLSLVQDFSYPVLSEFTIEFWTSLSIYRKDSGSYVGKTLKGKRIILTVVQESSVLTVSYQNQVIISWGQHVITTGFDLNETTWTHLSLSWRSNDGKFEVSLGNPVVQKTALVQYGIMVNQRFYIHRGFFIGHDGHGDLANVELVLAIDELYVWQFARKEMDIWGTITAKYKGYVGGLVMFCGFDEEQGIGLDWIGLHRIVVLCCVVLCCIVLCCVMLCCTCCVVGVVLCCVVLCCYCIVHNFFRTPLKNTLVMWVS